MGGEMAADAETSFRTPPAGMKMAAYWFWSSLPDDAEIESQLRDFRDKGYGTILIQARLSLPRHVYLGEAFLERYRRAVEEMQRLGLVAGLYDDYNWTSGQAGGRTVEGAPHLRERHLFWATVDGLEGEIGGIEAPFATGIGADIAGWIYEAGRPVFDEWEIVAALAHPPCCDDPSALRDVGAHMRLMPEGDGCRFTLDGMLAPGERLTVFIAARCRTSRLINYLLPEAGARFVEVGLEPFARALAGHMGTTLTFLFYDQPGPQFYSWRQKTGALGNSPLYAPPLRAAVEAAGDEPFAAVLFALVHQLGPATAALRLRFYQAYGRLMAEGFFLPVRDFCRRHGLRFTGHEILPHIGGFALNGGFSSIDPRVAPAVDFFGIDALRDETAVDVNNFSAQLSPRLGDSVARAHGRSRTMAEIYATATRTERRGAGQWELSPATLRAQAIRLHMAGVRQVIMHALYQSDGMDDDPRLFVNPRFDFAPGINFEPWWGHHGDLAAETARLSAFLDEAVPETPVAVLYPLSTAYVEGPRHAHAAHFGAWCAGLAALSAGHMILDEDSLSDATVSGGVLAANGLRFRALILPAATQIAAPALATIAAFAAAGGAVWLSGPVAPALGEATRRLCRQWPQPPDAGELHRLVAGLETEAPAIEADDVVLRFVGRDGAGAWRVVLFNDSERPAAVRVAVNGDYEIRDAGTGAISPIAKAGWLGLRLAPQDIVCLRTFPRSGSAPDVDLVQSDEVVEIRALGDGWSFQAGPDGKPGPISVGQGWQTQGYAAFSGTGHYACRFSLAEAADVHLDLPGVSVAVEADIDGRDCGRRARPPFRLDLGRLAAGEHMLRLRVSNTAANRYYAGTPFAGEPWPDESGLTAPPRLLLLCPRKR